MILMMQFTSFYIVHVLKNYFSHSYFNTFVLSCDLCIIITILEYSEFDYIIIYTSDFYTFMFPCH